MLAEISVTFCTLIIYLSIYLSFYLSIYLHEAESFLRSHQSLSYLRISKYFMVSEGSLPSLHQPSTGLRSEPDESSPYHPILFL
jgi:hypothetical protein